ncbi:TPA: creatininase family protein [Candidatus Poribacteria bacterium]|nr:creatininase family protein [Candidatus Poribacteria bacterium]
MVTAFNSWEEVAEADVEIAILPIGSIEQHGRHLPLGTDWLIADRWAKELGERLNAYVLPALPYGNSQEHMGFPGTITLRPQTLALVIEDIILSLRHHGIKKVVVLSAHGGNWIIKPTIRDLNFRYPDMTIIWSDGALPGERERIPEDIHSGRGETSTMLCFHPELVKMGRAEDFTPDVGQEYNDYVGFDRTTRCGVWGKPSEASEEMGRRNVEARIERQVRYIKATFERLERLK